MHIEKWKMQKLLLIYCSAPKRVTLFHSFCNFSGYCWSSVQICIGRFLYLCRPAKVIGIPQGRRSHLHGSIPMLLITCIFAVCQRFCQGVESWWFLFWNVIPDFIQVFLYAESRIFLLLLEGICGLRGIFECIFSQNFLTTQQKQNNPRVHSSNIW